MTKQKQKNCHPELVSGSKTKKETNDKTPCSPRSAGEGRVRDDKKKETNAKHFKQNIFNTRLQRNA